MMQGLIKFLKGLFPDSAQKSAEDTEKLRHDFRERYFYFRQLLAANNSALEGFAEIERLLRDTRPFGMSEVNANSTAVLVSVLRMIRKLDRLSPGKYAVLRERFNRIEARVTQILDLDQKPKDPRWVIDMAGIDMAMPDTVGRKMANLGELKNRLGLKVPEGFVMTAGACSHFFEANGLPVEINRRFKTVFSPDMGAMHRFSREIQDLILRAAVPDALCREIQEAVVSVERRHGGTVRFALRSSALGEDSPDASFAGQYKTLLNVRPDDVIQGYKEILAAKYSVTALQYRLNRGFRDEDIDMCVGCLAMVDAACGGVAYSRHPFEPGDDAVHIQSTWGLPKAVVDGTADCDLFEVVREPEWGVRRKEIRQKDKKYACYADEGECRFDFVDEMQSLPSLSDAQAVAVAQSAKKIEAHYGAPQDIEWAVKETGSEPDLFLLQSRPLKLTTQEPGRPAAPDLPGDLLPPTAVGGITAGPGKAAGEVFILMPGADPAQIQERMPDRAVLVAAQALPQWASLLGRAAAIITEKGGFASHLANVAREFEVPAIFGIPDACRRLKPGRRVTVDADRCKVFSGEIRALLETRAPKQTTMAGSPVHQTLTRIARHIIPLNLLDPDSTDFQPRNCNTLHDITRFIHEKSVAEMFNYGKAHGFDEVASKQLHDRVPMQWWVMNLDDGFAGEGIGKYIHIGDIASIPMRAVWEGIVAIPWDGPPALDRQGLMSVMFEATANTALNTGVKTRYSQRNYFMISKHYCSLNSRLGFHFTTLEAFVGERDPENYISFRFQGGAADRSRRFKRVQLIADLLSNYGFQTRIREDHLNARLKGYDRAYMADRLKIIGYLTIHTRQIDMVANNRKRTLQYYNKFRTDIGSAFNIHMHTEAGEKGTGENDT